MNLPREPGTYALLLRLRHADCLRVGAVGLYEFPAGWYIYVGSAFGSGGLAARVARHARAGKRLHWHIDFLLRRAELLGCWFSTGRRDECLWAERFAALPSARICVERFGASDCDCRTHLFLFTHRPSPPPMLAGARWWNRMRDDFA